MENILVIGIAGGSGSGKTTLTTRLAEQFPREEVTGDPGMTITISTTRS